MKPMFIRLRHEEHGAVMAEYALMTALIATAAAAAVSTFGAGVAALIQQAVDAFPGGAGPSDGGDPTTGSNNNPPTPPVRS